jgi:putative RecB family exonuclease
MEPSRLQIVKEYPRSVSQVKTWKACGERYRLERVEQKVGRPAAWFPMGTAVHEATERWNKAGRPPNKATPVAWFLEAYDREVNELCETVPNLDWWMASGPYKGPEDIMRRREIGQEHVVKYIDYYLAQQYEKIWVTPDGVPAIELEFEADFDGVKLRGFIDSVVEFGGRVIVEDTKTGNKPDPAFQLAVYKLALEQVYPGLEVEAGRYFMTKHGKPTNLYDLSEWTYDKMCATFKEMDQGVKAEAFPPNPGSVCARCGVAWACDYAVGEG